MINSCPTSGEYYRSRPIFIYSSMFKSWTLVQPYVLQVDTTEKILLLSLTPTYGNFKVYQPVDTFRLYTHYNWHDFIRIEPNESITLELDYHYNDSIFYSIRITDPLEYVSVLEKVEFPLSNSIVKDYSIGLRLALFESIRFLTDPSLSREYFSLRDKFKVLDVQIE